MIYIKNLLNFIKIKFHFYETYSAKYCCICLILRDVYISWQQAKTNHDEKNNNWNNNINNHFLQRKTRNGIFFKRYDKRI